MKHVFSAIMSFDNSELKIEAAVGSKTVNIYVEELLEDIEKTVMEVFYVGEKGKYKHFTYVLGTGKTRMVLSDLVDGTYEGHATQISRNGDAAEGTVRFDYSEVAYDLLDELQQLNDNLKR